MLQFVRLPTRGVQTGPLCSGPRGRRFKSSHPDVSCRVASAHHGQRRFECYIHSNDGWPFFILKLTNNRDFPYTLFVHSRHEHEGQVELSDLPVPRSFQGSAELIVGMYFGSKPVAHNQRCRRETPRASPVATPIPPLPSGNGSPPDEALQQLLTSIRVKLGNAADCMSRALDAVAVECPDECDTSYLDKQLTLCQDQIALARALGICLSMECPEMAMEAESTPLEPIHNGKLFPSDNGPYEGGA